ncbi:hypothetical protein B1M_38721 [Burkholderia sp. TJI49]|nr:hypothetical protein B1M_38721 [Burkholderia sp. TJI49]
MPAARAVPPSPRAPTTYNLADAQPPRRSRAATKEWHD